MPPAPPCGGVTALPLVYLVVPWSQGCGHPHRLRLPASGPPGAGAQKQWVMLLEGKRRPLEISWSSNCSFT